MLPSENKEAFGILMILFFFYNRKKQSKKVHCLKIQKMLFFFTNYEYSDIKDVLYSTAVLSA